MVRKKTGFDINQFEMDPAMDINSRFWQSNNKAKETLSERTDNNSRVQINDKHPSVDNLHQNIMVDNNNNDIRNNDGPNELKHQDAKFDHRVAEFQVYKFGNNQDNVNYYKDKHLKDDSQLNMYQDYRSSNNNHQHIGKYKDTRFVNYDRNNDRYYTNVPRYQYDRFRQIHNQIDNRYYDTNGHNNQHLYTFSDRFINNLEKYQKLMEEWNKVIDMDEKKSIERGGQDRPKKTSKKPTVSCCGSFKVL